jgi:glutamine amidotransferase
MIDCGVGNLRSVQKAFEAVGGLVEITSDPQDVLAADKVILPGVGAFGDEMKGLQNRGLVKPLQQLPALGKPLLGICVGMQVLFEAGEEMGSHAGLGILPGQVRRLIRPDLKIPHTGWNQIIPRRSSPLFNGLATGAYAYFNHSYYCYALPEDILAVTDYGGQFSSVVGRGNVFGIQFHPEKSQNVGLALLRNFLNLPLPTEPDHIVSPEVQ